MPRIRPLTAEARRGKAEHADCTQHTQMKSILLNICLLATAAAYTEEDNVVVLTPDNFDAFIAETPTTLVEL